MQDSEVKQAVIKRALGYETDEVVEEYGFNDGQEVLIKRKVTKKSVPPDIQAVKILQESESKISFEDMTDDELCAEKNRLLQLLQNYKEVAN